MRRILLPLLLAVSALSGCSTFERAERTTRSVERDQAKVAEIINAAQKQRQFVEREQVLFHDGAYASLEPVETKQADARARLLCNGDAEVGYSPRAPQDILEFSQFITNLCGVPIRVMPDAITAIQSQGRLALGQQQGVGMTIQPGQPIPAQGMPGTISAGQYGQAIGGRAGLIEIKYKGSLPGLLDSITNRLGVSWKIVDNAVAIFHTETRTFRIFSQPYSYDQQTTVQSGTTTTTGVSSSGTGTTGSGGISGTSGSQQVTTITMKGKRWADIDKTVREMLTPGVGRSAGSESTGTYTVTDIPEVLGKVETYIDVENKSLKKQVLFNVRLLSVTSFDNSGLNIDWTLIYRAASGRWGLNLTNVTQPDSSAVALKPVIPNTATGNAAQFSGSQAVISALEQQGRVSEVMSPTVVALNHHTVPVQFGSQVSYIAGAQTTNTAQVGSTTAITMGTITTGLNMRLTPYLMPDNELLLDVAVNVSALRRLRQVSSNGSQAEAPDLDNRIIAQAARLRIGQPLILTGFEQLRDSADRSGVGDATNIIFGGAVKSETTRSMVVMLITPEQMD